MDHSERIIPEVGCGSDDWIKKLLNDVVKSINDSDEAMVVGEAISNPEQTFANSADNKVDDDDDCVVLDGDPNKPVAIENDGGCDSDELCLVGEKGQVACRDYPHPRHLCVKFPFDSTPHEKHCDKCYCYVCDSAAPCVHWGNGVSNTDHCHATEKNKLWEAQRKGAKMSHQASPLVSKVGLTPMNQVPSLPCNSLMHNQELPASQPCRSVASTGSQLSVMQSQPHLVPGDLQSQRQSVGHARSQFIPQAVPFKRSGLSEGILSTIRHLNSLSRYPDAHELSVNQSLGSRWQDPRERGNPTSSTNLCTEINFGEVATNFVPYSSTQSPTSSGIGNYATSQSQPQVHSGIVSANSATPHPQLYSQTCMGGGNLGSLMPTVPVVTAMQRLGSYLASPVPLEPQAASQPNVYCNEVSTQFCVNSQGNINYPSESPDNFYGETLMSQNNHSLAVKISQPVIQISNLGNLVPIGPVEATLPRWENHCNPMSSHLQAAPQPNVCQNVVSPQQVGLTSHGYPEGPVNFYVETPVSQNSQPLPAVGTELQSSIVGEKPAVSTNLQWSPSSDPHQQGIFRTWSFDQSAWEDLDVPLSPGVSPESAPMDGGFFDN